jgi:MFS family permease
MAALFTSGSSFGAFCGRFVTGAVADLANWRASFAATSLLTADAGASQEPAAARDLRGRLRRREEASRSCRQFGGSAAARRCFNAA